jgi:hypothetical protein
MTASALRKCPECGKQKLKRLIGTGAGVLFKGSGFYETDYRSDSYKSAAKADTQTSGGGGSGGIGDKTGDKPAKSGDSVSSKPTVSSAPVKEKPSGSSRKPD